METYGDRSYLVVICMSFLKRKPLCQPARIAADVLGMLKDCDMTEPAVAGLGPLQRRADPQAARSQSQRKRRCSHTPHFALEYSCRMCYTFLFVILPKGVEPTRLQSS